MDASLAADACEELRIELDAAIEERDRTLESMEHALSIEVKREPNPNPNPNSNPHCRSRLRGIRRSLLHTRVGVLSR